MFHPRGDHERLAEAHGRLANDLKHIGCAFPHTLNARKLPITGLG
jgi:hypothetical protein